MKNINIFQAEDQRCSIASLSFASKAGKTQIADSVENLVFLQKRHANPNPHIIGYKFPGSAAASYSPVAARLLNSSASSNVYKFLFNFFKSMYCLISKPVFITTPEKIKIQLFYFVVAAANGNSALAAPRRGLAAAPQQQRQHDLSCKFKLICGILSKFFNKTVELELIRLHKPYYDSTILVNFLALIINKKNIANCIKKLYDSQFSQSSSRYKATAAGAINVASRASYLAGLNIKISGRLMREPIIPRITTKKFDKGFTANGKINYSDVARFTHKNRKGAFTITIKSGQKF